MKALVTVFLISLFSVDFLFGAGLITDNPTNNPAEKSTGLEARYDFSISFKNSNLDFPESIVVTIKGKSDSISLNGLVFQFISSNGSYWAYHNDFNYSKNSLIIPKDSIFRKEFRIDDLQFKSFATYELISFITLKKAMLSNTMFKVLATIGDMSKAKNPYESNLSSSSNIIEYTPVKKP